MLVAHEKRRREPSYSMPFLFEALELSLIWIVFSLFEGTGNVMQWSLITYSLASVWLLYTLFKLKRVLSRQIINKF